MRGYFVLHGRGEEEKEEKQEVAGATSPAPAVRFAVCARLVGRVCFRSREY